MGSAGEAAMSDLEFQRELSPEQIREALSLLDSTAGAKNQNSGIGDSRPAEEVNPEPDQSSTTMATQDRPPAAEDPQQRKKHLNLAVAFLGIGMAIAGALALLSWPESVPPPPMLGSFTSSSRNRGRRRQGKAILLRCRLPSLHLTKVQVDQATAPAAGTPRSEWCCKRCGQ